MSNGDDADDPGEESDGGTDSDGPSPEARLAEAQELAAGIDDRLDEVESALEAAETEADLDEVEADLDDAEADLEAIEVPDPPEAVEEDDEAEWDDPTEPVESRLGDLQDSLADQRGPYGEDVESDLSGAAGTIRNTRWTVDGAPEVRAAVETFLETASEELPGGFEADAADDDELEAHAAALERVGEAVTEEGPEPAAGLDADEDAETIAALLSATDELESGLEAAEEWDDLEVVEQLRREGFYDRLTPENRKDFPPELNAIRVAEAENDPERILLGLEQFDSDFMQENCIDALARLGPEAAFDQVHQLAQRRDEGAIEVLGKIGDDRAVETLVDFVDGNNPPLQKVTLRALGEIGSEEATQPVANALADEDPAVRSVAARALGLVGDTRAVDPLAEKLADREAANEVRASAAWALVQIGTERALEAAAEFDDDRVYTVQVEAEKARAATPT